MPEQDCTDAFCVANGHDSYEVTPDALPGERNPDGFLLPHFAQRQDVLRLHWWTVCEDAELGEPGFVPTATAIANAIYDACGVRLYDLPMTAEKVYSALQNVRDRK